MKSAIIVSVLFSVFQIQPAAASPGNSDGYGIKQRAVEDARINAEDAQDLAALRERVIRNNESLLSKIPSNISQLVCYDFATFNLNVRLNGSQPLTTYSWGGVPVEIDVHILEMRAKLAMNSNNFVILEQIKNGTFPPEIDVCSYHLPNGKDCRIFNPGVGAGARTCL